MFLHGAFNKCRYWPLFLSESMIRYFVALLRHQSFGLHLIFHEKTHIASSENVTKKIQRPSNCIHEIYNVNTCE